MGRWYVEVAFLVLACFALGAGLTAFVMARVLPQSFDPFPPSRRSRPSAGRTRDGGTT